MIPLVVKFADTKKQKQARLQRQLYAKHSSTAGAVSAYWEGQKQACEGHAKAHEPESEKYSIDLTSLLVDWDPLVDGKINTSSLSPFWMDFTFFKNALGSISFSVSNCKCVTKDTITHSEHYEMNALANNVSFRYVSPIIGSMHPHLQLP